MMMPGQDHSQYGTGMGGGMGAPGQFGMQNFGGQGMGNGQQNSQLGYGPGGSSSGAQMNMGPPSGKDSFARDGFNIMGKQQMKQKVDEEGSKEFADLFSLADSKIKDRDHQKPNYGDYQYNPAQ